MCDDEEIYDDTGDFGSNMSEPTGLSALKARFEQAQNTAPNTGPKPLTPKPKPPQKYGGGGGLNICAVGDKKEGGAPVALNAKNAFKEENDFVARVKPSGVSSGVPLKKRDSKVNIPDAFLQKVENTPKEIKPKPSIKPNKWSSDSNNNAKVNGVTAELENVLAHKRPSVTSTSKQSDSENTSGGKVSPRNKSTDSSIPESPLDSPKPKTSPGIATGVGVLAQVARFAGDSNTPLDFRSKLKHVDQKKNIPSSFSVSPKPLNDIDSKDVPWRKNLKSALFRERTKSIRSVIRVSDGKKFLKVDDSSLSDDGPPEKPEKLDCDIDLTALETDFKEAVESIVVSEKEQHGWTEVEEMYDDCGNLRPVSTRAVSLMGTGPKPKPRKRVPLIEPMTEDEELEAEKWKNAGFGGIPELPEDLPPPPPGPSDNIELLDQQEMYDDVAVAERVPEEGLEQDEMYEELPDEPLPESSPPSLGPKPPVKPPEVPSPLPKTPNNEKTENDNSENKSATDQALIDAKEQKRLEKERKKREKEEKKLLETKEKELKKLLKVLGHKVTPELLTTSVGKGKVKSNAKGKEKSGDLTVAEGDEVDIIRMIDNPAGKWLVRILSSQKDKELPHGPYSPLERIGYCDEKNIEVDTSSILNYMKGSGGQNSGTPAPSEQDQETYEAVDEVENPIEDEIYEECN